MSAIVKPDTQRNTQTVQLSQTFQAPVAQVYQAWIQPSAFKQWFGCGHAEIQDIELDVRIGGSWKLDLKSNEDGEPIYINGTYQEVVPNQKLSFTWNVDSAKDTLVTILFRDLGGSTEITLTHERFADAAVAEPHAQGWANCLESMEAYLKKAA